MVEDWEQVLVRSSGCTEADPHIVNIYRIQRFTRVVESGHLVYSTKTPDSIEHIDPLDSILFPFCLAKHHPETRPKLPQTTPAALHRTPNMYSQQ